MQPLFPEHIETIIGFVAGATISSAQVVLIRDTWTRKISPSLFSWIGWGLLIGVGCLSQWLEEGWEHSLTGLAASAVGCFLVAGIAFAKGNYLLNKSDRIFLYAGLFCLAFYLTLREPWTTTSLAIIADFVVGFPTLIAAWQKPETQRSAAWIIGGISWTITLCIAVGHGWLYAVFPIYLWLYNWAMAVLTNRKVRAN